MSSIETARRAAATPCPRCTKPLTDAAGLGWCPACGYCRSLEEAPSQADLQLPAIPEATPAVGPKIGVPLWVWPLVGGVALIVGASYLLGKQLAAKPFERALCATLQIGGGIILLFIGQFLTLLRLAPEDEKLGFKDAVLPFRLYGLAFARLPRFGFSVWFLGWGASLIVSALVFVGGLGHWLTYIKGNKDRNQPSPIKGR